MGARVNKTQPEDRLLVHVLAHLTLTVSRTPASDVTCSEKESWNPGVLSPHSEPQKTQVEKVAPLSMSLTKD